jgi:cell wall-associated protease
MKKTTTILFLIYIMLLGCTKKLSPIIYEPKNITQRALTNVQKRNWQNLDIETDTILGTSLNQAYKKIIKSKKGAEIIIAVLDTEFDIEHEGIKSNLWLNTKEIPDNGIDDDKNGYADDIHGWNFVANNKGESIINSSYECSRILRYFKKNPIANLKDSALFAKATLHQNELNKTFETEKKRIDYYKSVFPRCYKTIKQFFPDGNYSKKQIDSLFKLYEKKGDKILYYDLYLLNELKKANLDSIWVSSAIKSFDYDSQTIYNENYNEKEITKDDDYNIKDSIYGSNNVSKYAKKTWHGTQVMGLVNSCYLGHKNINIKIMPIVFSGIGGEDNDKDILTAIKYAVNNGAKVINMSSGKLLSLHPEWLKEAVLYAEKKDVLIVTSAGNTSKNIDNDTKYLLDYDEETGKEFSNNLIRVGGISYNLNKNLLCDFSNYGHTNVDIFVPSDEIYVPDATEGYTFNSGTSLGAAIMTGIAGLIRSYYPKLTAAQVKEIIMQSGVSYDLQVQVPGEKEGVLQPFSEMSKSGKVVNAYNALLMAAGYNKKR